jgi:hypothetical protein
MWPRADRIRQSSSDLFGNDAQTYRSDFTVRQPGVALTCEEKALTLTAGERGLQALVLQYPRRGQDQHVAPA